MSVLNRSRTAPPDPATAAPPLAPAGPSATLPMSRVPHTRTGAAWFGICSTALIFAVLIVFMLQNTRSVEITFLWMHGSLPLALALLIAAAGTAILAMVVGTARTTQLRRASRRQRP
jgi:uncharacterized integral membrane protein